MRVRYLLASLVIFIVSLFILSVLPFLIFFPRSRQSRKSQEAKGVPQTDMVKDPLCETYVLKEKAVERWVVNDHYFFCSEACAERYMNLVRRGA